MGGGVSCSSFLLARVLGRWSLIFHFSFLFSFFGSVWWLKGVSGYWVHHEGFSVRDIPAREGRRANCVTWVLSTNGYWNRKEKKKKLLSFSVLDTGFKFAGFLGEGERPAMVYLSLCC